MDQLDFLKGALIGGALGGIAAILLAPKAGKDLRHDIVEGYNAINKGARDYAHDFKDYAHDFSDNAHHFMHSLNGNGAYEDEDDSHPNAFLAGGAAGALLGALAGLLLAPQSGEKLREYFGDEYDHMRSKAKTIAKEFHKKEQDFESKLEDWQEIFANIVEKLSNSSKRHAKNGSIAKILDLANIGMNLYSKAYRR